MRRFGDVSALGVIVGLTLVVAGVAFWFWPAALVVAGSVLVVFFVDLD